MSRRFCLTQSQLCVQILKFKEDFIVVVLTGKWTIMIVLLQHERELGAINMYR